MKSKGRKKNPSIEVENLVSSYFHVINPRTDALPPVQKAKIGRNKGCRGRGGEIRGTAFHGASINEFPLVHRLKMAPL